MKTITKTFISLLTLGAIVAPVSILATSCKSNAKSEVNCFKFVVGTKSDDLLVCTNKELTFTLNHDGEWNMNGAYGAPLGRTTETLAYAPVDGDTVEFATWSVINNIALEGRILFTTKGWFTLHRPSWIPEFNN